MTSLIIHQTIYTQCCPSFWRSPTSEFKKKENILRKQLVGQMHRPCDPEGRDIGVTV